MLDAKGKLERGLRGLREARGMRGGAIRFAGGMAEFGGFGRFLAGVKAQLWRTRCGLALSCQRSHYHLLTTIGAGGRAGHRTGGSGLRPGVCGGRNGRFGGGGNPLEVDARINNRLHGLWLWPGGTLLL